MRAPAAAAKNCGRSDGKSICGRTSQHDRRSYEATAFVVHMSTPQTGDLRITAEITPITKHALIVVCALSKIGSYMRTVQTHGDCKSPITVGDGYAARHGRTYSDARGSSRC